jgi:hypothetical protein
MIPSVALAAAQEDPDAILRSSVVYQRFDALGMSDRVRCYFLRGSTGSSGSLIVDDRIAFVEDLRATGRFCEDSRGGGMLHGGQTSLRESSPDSNQALHIIVGSGDYIWVHTDSVSPNVWTKEDGHCLYDRHSVTRHIRRDVLHIRRDLQALLYAAPRAARRAGRRHRNLAAA